MGQSWLVLGGARSGKTRRALAIAGGYAGPVYIATAETRDSEMQDRIARHRAERGPEWTTVEAPLDLCGALLKSDAPGKAILVDCLTLWLSNLMEAELPLEAETGKLVQMIKALSATVVLVSNEVGLGIVPDNALARAFRDAQGRLNQAVAAAADHVEMIVAGLPLVIK
jgi:adenosylcobinamide kinase/adenosylcobinamide-phosphate guanylyltransferase